ncbi:helix-turn-helix transcriptional regulator [Bordetella genomosp. 6]|uniref:helix-turn-helix transcriptional regulator n=1 Tax=Bordetella genomosp. 6 TaxID=463024 RepID=UPI000A28D42C|nr:helix-turn-helix transcriptional regulator [Bordetella genomosp. 6]ARP75111.1 transcriptional regulator [Bordetella genomosp. 6]
MNSATHLAAHEGSARRRQALGEFVRTARARITPQMAGLPAGSRRRTPGLRREEVAQLSDISVTWYTWIEQGREVTVSPAVWARIANVLHLARAERAYLFELAECADPQQPRDEGGDAPVSLQACVDAIDAPAYALDRAWNVLASNAAMRELFDDWPLRDAQPNLLRYIFLDPAARELVVDWDQRARRVVAEFRADAGAHLDEADVVALLDELNRASPVFAHWWTRHAVVEREGGLREFQHPRSGRQDLQQITFRLATHPELKLVMLLPS